MTGSDGAIYFVDIKQGRPSLSLRSAGAALRVGYGVAQTALRQPVRVLAGLDTVG